RFPTRHFVRDVEAGVVEGGFLSVLPVWIALAASFGGVEPALHVSGAFGLLSLAFAMLACAAASRATPPPHHPNPPPPGGGRQSPLSPGGGEGGGEGAIARGPDVGEAPDRVSSSGSTSMPSWPIVGGVLALAFSQVWWAREPMAESALGAFSWLVAWASV